MEKKYEQITAPLWRDGYHAAAKLIERLSSSLQSDVEMDWMKRYARESSFDDEICCDRLRMLWTTYCLHYGLDVDTFRYDCNLEELWKVVAETELEATDWGDLESFGNFMCKYLV